MSRYGIQVSEEEKHKKYDIIPSTQVYNCVINILQDYHYISVLQTQCSCVLFVDFKIAQKETINQSAIYI